MSFSVAANGDEGKVSKRKILMLLAVAGAIAAFFLVVPVAEQFAGQYFGWDQRGQEAFGKFAFFPILVGLLIVLRWLSMKKEPPPNSG